MTEFSELTPAQQAHLLNIEVVFVQDIYNQFKTLGITLAIGEFPAIIYKAMGNLGDPSFDDLVTDKLLALPQYDNVMALGLSRNQTLTLVELPDFHSIKDWINNNPLRDHDRQWELQTGSLKIVADVVSVV